MQLAGEYADLQGHPAWQDFQARLESIRSMLERGILQGEVNHYGLDLTPDMRTAYGIVLQMLSIPAEIEQQKALAEEQILGLPPDRVPFDTSV